MIDIDSGYSHWLLCFMADERKINFDPEMRARSQKFTPLKIATIHMSFHLPWPRIHQCAPYLKRGRPTREGLRTPSLSPAWESRVRCLVLVENNHSVNLGERRRERTEFTYFKSANDSGGTPRPAACIVCRLDLHEVGREHLVRLDLFRELVSFRQIGRKMSSKASGSKPNRQWHRIGVIPKAILCHGNTGGVANWLQQFQVLRIYTENNFLLDGIEQEIWFQ